MKNTTVKTTYTVLNPETKVPPTIIFSQKALKWIKNIIKIHNGEVGFYGVVDTKPDYTFYVRDIFYPKQQLVSACTCEISVEGGTLVSEWLINHDRADDVGKMILWGHSHHSMGVEPSSQDNSQALDLIKSNGHNLIRIIVNNAELMAVSFFDYTKGIRFDHVKWDEEKANEDRFLYQKLQEINNIMTSTDDPKLKIEKINKVSNEDLEEKQIIEKIEELKKVNIPKIVTTTYPPYDGYGYDEFGRNNSYGKWGNYNNYKRSYQDGKQLSFLQDFSPNHKKNKNKNKNKNYVHNSISSNSFLDDSQAEVSKIMDRWDEL